MSIKGSSFASWEQMVWIPSITFIDKSKLCNLCVKKQYTKYCLDCEYCLCEPCHTAFHQFPLFKSHRPIAASVLDKMPNHIKVIKVTPSHLHEHAPIRSLKTKNGVQIVMKRRWRRDRVIELLQEENQELRDRLHETWTQIDEMLRRNDARHLQEQAFQLKHQVRENEQLRSRLGQANKEVEELVMSVKRQQKQIDDLLLQIGKMEQTNQIQETHLSELTEHSIQTDPTDVFSNNAPAPLCVHYVAEWRWSMNDWNSNVLFATTKSQQKLETRYQQWIVSDVKNAVVLSLPFTAEKEDNEEIRVTVDFLNMIVVGSSCDAYFHLSRQLKRIVYSNPLYEQHCKFNTTTIPRSINTTMSYTCEYLIRDSNEFQLLEQLFHSKGHGVRFDPMRKQGYEIRTIQKIHHRALQVQYEVYRRTRMDIQSPCLLFHGTSGRPYLQVVREGADPRLANGRTMMGRGVYLTRHMPYVNACYAHIEPFSSNYTGRADRSLCRADSGVDEIRTVLVMRVLLGRCIDLTDYAYGRPNLTRPPQLSPAIQNYKSAYYDSTTMFTRIDGEPVPIYCIYNAAQLYPAYIVQYSAL